MKTQVLKTSGKPASTKAPVGHRAEQQKTRLLRVAGTSAQRARVDMVGGCRV